MRRILFALLLVMSACTDPAPDATLSSTPDTVYINGTFWTANLAALEADAMAVAGERIIALGTEDSLRAMAGPETEIVDLDGAFVIPGFIDNHVHFLQGGFQLASVDLRDAASPEEFTRRIEAFAATQPAGTWITGGDWDHEAWGGELPRKEWIDAVTPDHPVFVSRLDGHMALANSAALAAAGVDASTADIEGGTIVRNASGEPTGVLKDEAMSPVYRVIPEPSEEAFDEALARAMEHAVSLGVTQVHDVGSYGGWTDLDVYRRAHERDALKTRIYSFVPLSTWSRLVEFIGTDGKGDEMLRWGGLKGFVDGSLGSTTAWFYQPYEDEPGTAGLLVNDTAAVRRQVLAADSAGLHLAIHAIGDRANDWLLDVYQAAEEAHGERDRRFRIEHAQHLTPSAIQRFGPERVVPSMQPYHAIDDGRWAEKRIGSTRILTTYAFNALINARAPLTFGSDWTVGPLDPLLGIYAAVTRRTIDDANPDGWVPAQKISVEQALFAYTLGNARAGFQEDMVGTLEPGKYADFTVLDRDLRTIDPTTIPDARVLGTFVAGRQVYRAAE